MANFSDFHVYVDWQEFDRAKAGDVEAKKALAAKLDGVDIYFHAFPVRANDIPVTIPDLICAGIVDRITLHTTHYPQALPISDEPRLTETEWEQRHFARRAQEAIGNQRPRKPYDVKLKP